MLTSIFSIYKNIAIKLLLLLIWFLFSQFIFIGASYSYSDQGDYNGGTDDYDAGYGNTSSGHSAPGSSGDYDAGYGNGNTDNNGPSGGTSHSDGGNTSNQSWSNNSNSSGHEHGDHIPSCVISASPTSLVKGNTTTLKWSTIRTNTASINQGVGYVLHSPDGTMVVSPTTNTTYTMTVTSIDNLTRTCAVTVTTVTDPVCSPQVFKVGMEIETTANLRVRSNPSLTTTFLGVQRNGSKGVIVDGPIVADGYYWYKTDYASGHDGWNASCWLLHKANRIPPATPTPICTTDAIPCSDGSFVQRSGPNCEFICPAIASYSLSDISYVTKVSYGNHGLYIGIDIYTVVLKNGTSYKVGIYNRGELSNAEIRLRATGYTGDVKELMALANKTFTSSGIVLGASTNIYDEIGNTLSGISLLLDELIK